jgi:hypothetical protein
MRTCPVWVGICLTLLSLAAGCSKSAETDKMPPSQIQGVDVDIPRLSAEFAKAKPEIQEKVNDAVTKVRYKRYMQAMMDLDEVLNSPGLDDKQKKLVTQVTGQLKEVIAKGAPDQGAQ